MKLGDLYKEDDWKKEKHIPVIEAPDITMKDQLIQVKISVGKEIPHPNKTEHHIRWIAVYFLPAEEKFPLELTRISFSSHGESVGGPDTSTIYTHHELSFSFITGKPGLILASSYCNIHGLWQSSKALNIK